MTAHPFENQPQGGATTKVLRPKDAATLLLFDRSEGALRVLMGRRGRGHAFMPDFFVFPGGRRDRGDPALPVARDLHPLVLEQLTRAASDASAVRRARGIAAAAIRELQEETGLVIGGIEGNGPDAKLRVDLGSLRYVARAITPPGNVRRFDTHFFCTFTDEAGVDPQAIRDSSELQDLQWLDMAGMDDLNMPSITRTILDDVRKQMQSDPSLPFGSGGPFYYARHGRFHRGSI